MKNNQIKQMIIENFIDYFTSDDKERDKMKQSACLYVSEDHVDEISFVKNWELTQKAYKQTQNEYIG